MKRRYCPLAVAAAILGTTGAGTGTAAAQGAPLLEQIVVTAQKREESLQDTPISLVAFGSDNIEKLGITEVGSLQGKVPNLQLTPHPNSTTTPRIFIRGVGNFDDQITQDPSVALYMDGVYMARNQGMGMEVADLERIEVLRGPQGTLYGRNATGGAINFVTRAPNLDELEFRQSLTFGRRDQFRSRTMLNVPLGDTVAARVAYVTSERDGFVRNAGTGESHFGSEDREALRFDLRWQPASDWDLRYVYDRSRIEDTPFHLAITPAGAPLERPRQGNPAVTDLQAHDVTIEGHQFTAAWDLSDNLSLKSITAYREVDSFLYQDYLTGRFGPIPSLLTRDDTDQRQTSQEFQALGSALDGRLEYIAGVYYFRESGDGQNLSQIPAFGIVTQANTEINNRAYALFAHGTYTPDALAQRLHITLGGRWSRDERRASLDNFVVPGGNLVPTSSGRGSNDFTDFSPSLTLAWDLADDANIYIKAASGYKTGGFNVRASTIERFERGFDEERLLSWEAGIKSQWWQNRLRVNGAVFYADYEDIQLNTQSDISDPTRSDILNAGEATIQGMELDITAVLHRDLTLAFSYGYLDTNYDRIIDGTGSDVTDQYAFVNAPRHSYTLDLDYAIADLAFGELSLNVNYSWQDEKVSTVSLAQGRYEIGDYGLLNARLTLAEIAGIPTGNLRIAAWGRNLENKTYAFINAPLFGGMRAYGEPRSYGLDLIYEY